MTVKLTNGTAVTKTGLNKTAFTDDDPKFVINTDLWEDTQLPGSNSLGTRRLVRAGEVVTQSQIDSWYPAAAITSINPASGPAAGGTTVTITGKNLRGVTEVTFGGTAGTSPTVVNETTVTVVTPAKSAGAYDVVVTDDSGASAPLTNGFTFA